MCESVLFAEEYKSTTIECQFSTDTIITIRILNVKELQILK